MSVESRKYVICWFIPNRHEVTIDMKVRIDRPWLMCHQNFNIHRGTASLLFHGKSFLAALRIPRFADETSRSLGLLLVLSLPVGAWVRCWYVFYSMAHNLIRYWLLDAFSRTRRYHYRASARNARVQWKQIVSSSDCKEKSGTAAASALIGAKTWSPEKSRTWHRPIE